MQIFEEHNDYKYTRGELNREFEDLGITYVTDS